MRFDCADKIVQQILFFDLHISHWIGTDRIKMWIDFGCSEATKIINKINFILFNATKNLSDGLNFVYENVVCFVFNPKKKSFGWD